MMNGMKRLKSFKQMKKRFRREKNHLNEIQNDVDAIIRSVESTQR